MDNYKAFKNYLHNDLGITKEYIDGIIKKAVKDEVRNYLKDDTIVRKIFLSEMNKAVGNKYGFHTICDMTNIISDEINKAICEEVKNKINITLKE